MSFRDAFLEGAFTVPGDGCIDYNPLLKNDKVFLSPHAAAFTEECMTRMAKETIQNIFDFFDGNLEDSKKVKL